jgi:hypothetical protein
VKTFAFGDCMIIFIQPFDWNSNNDPMLCIMEPDYLSMYKGCTIGVQFPAGVIDRIFSLRHRVKIKSGILPAPYRMGTRGSYPRVKRPGCETDQPHPSSTEVKNAWSYTSTPPIRPHGAVIEHRENFTFTLTFCIR